MPQIVQPKWIIDFSVELAIVEIEYSLATKMVPLPQLL